MFISVLAYHILHIIEYRLWQKDDCRSWATIRNILKTHERSTICYQTKDEVEQIHQQFVASVQDWSWNIWKFTESSNYQAILYPEKEWKEK